MKVLLSEIAVSAAAFISTNLDDMCLLILFFSMLKERKQVKYVVAGEYLGIATLCLASLLISRGLAVVLGRYLWIIGIVPIGFGIKAVIDLIRNKGEGEVSLTAEGTWMLIFTEWVLTVTNGGDNLSIYIPLIGDFGSGFFTVFFITMMLMTTLWWVIALSVRRIPAVSSALSKTGKYILPAVFIAVGAFTIFKGICK